MIYCFTLGFNSLIFDKVIEILFSFLRLIFITFSWKLPIEPKDVNIIVYDILGNEVSMISTAKIFDQKTIDVENWGSGIYSYALFSHGVKLGNGKFTVY